MLLQFSQSFKKIIVLQDTQVGSNKMVTAEVSVDSNH